MAVSKSSHIILDGDVVSSGSIRDLLTNRTFMYGEGCFDTLRAYSGGFLHPEGHLKRLQNGMNWLNWNVPEPLRDVASFLEMLTLYLKSNGMMQDEARVRIQVWNDDKTAGFRPGNPGIHFLITGSTLNTLANSPLNTLAGSPLHSNTVSPGDFTDRIIKKGAALITSRIRRIPMASLPSDVKWSNGINYILAAREAQQKKADDALMLTQDGYLSETTISNIFWKKGGTVCTPSSDCDLLPGITRGILIDLLRKSETHVQTGKYEFNAILDADTVWACNSVREIYPVLSIDDKKYHPDVPFLDMLDGLFRKRRVKSLQYAMP